MATIESYYNLNPLILNTGHYIMESGSVLRDLSGPFFRLLYIIGGKGRLIHNNDITYLKENHIYAIQPYYNIDFFFDSAIELKYIHVYVNSQNYHNLLDSFQFKIEIEAIPLNVSLIDRVIQLNPKREIIDRKFNLPQKDISLSIKTITQQKSDFKVRLETEIIILQLLSYFLTYKKNTDNHIDSRIRKAMQYINENIESNISEDTLASIASMSKDYFIRLFRKELNSTPCKYINEKKIEWAQAQMLISNISVKDLAERLGYSDTSYFIRVFTKITGKTPYKYRSTDL